VVNISELAAAAGVTTWTVRGYETQGVLPASRQQANGDASAAARLVNRSHRCCYWYIRVHADDIFVGLRTV
jgi:hypothetical protein